MTELLYQWDWERIDTRLTKQFPYSRNFFHHIIERWGVKIGKVWETGKIIKKSYTLKDWEMIIIDDLQRYLSAEILEEAPKIDIPIVKETDDYLIINKPKWVLSHPNSVWDVGHPSIVGFLYHNFKDLPSIGNFIRAWLLHRLDKETDGLMIIAKTEKWLAHFKNLFKKKSESETLEEKESCPLKKFYRATCYLTEDWKEFLKTIKWELPYLIEEMVIAKVPHCVPKIGITKIMKILDETKETVTFEIEILTWRTHQIRYHLSQYGLPIIGDYVYGKDEATPMGLTAYKLVFEDLDGKMIEVKI